MNIWILEQNEANYEALSKALRNLATSMGIPAHLTIFSTPSDVLDSLGDNSGADILFFNPDCYDDVHSGLSLAHTLFRQGTDCSLIPVCETAQYAYESYFFNAEGYVLYNRNIPHQLRHILQRLYYRYENEAETLCFSVRRHKYAIPLARIICLESYGHHTIIHTASQDFKSYVSLSSLRHQISPKNSFLCVGKSYIINLTYVQNFTQQQITLENGYQIPIPVRLQRSLYEELQTRHQLANSTHHTGPHH